jgi:hypothetical protein
MPCEHCLKIEPGRRGKPGHEFLKETAPVEKIRNSGQKSIGVRRYACTQCGTTWVHEDDKNDDYAGWSMEG